MYSRNDKIHERCPTVNILHDTTEITVPNALIDTFHFHFNLSMRLTNQKECEYRDLLCSLSTSIVVVFGFTSNQHPY